MTLALHLQLNTIILKRFVSTVMSSFDNFKYSKNYLVPCVNYGFRPVFYLLSINTEKLMLLTFFLAMKISCIISGNK